MQAVAEAWRNLTAVGARPLAITDNMNFGNPERPEIMGQFAAAIRGMAAACEALDFPVVSGNVSLYNETAGRAARRTRSCPRRRSAALACWRMPHRRSASRSRPGSIWCWSALPRAGSASRCGCARSRGREDGAPPPVDLAAERAAGDFVRGQILAGAVRACHDVSDGGLLVAVAEMAMAGRVGVRLSAGPRDIPSHAFWFGEDQGRYVLAVADSAAMLRAAEAVGVPALRLGTSGGQDLTLPDGGTISVASAA